MIQLFLALLPLLGLGHSNLFMLSTTYPGTQACGLLSPQLASTITAQEPWYCPISNQVTNEWKQWLPVMVIVTLIAFLIASVIFMAGVALGSAKIRSYGLAEFYEAIATAIIVGAFVYVCAVVFGLGPGVLVGGINPYATAFNLMGSTIASTQNMYSSIYASYIPLSESTSVSIGISGPEAGLTRKVYFASAEVAAAESAVFLNVYDFLITVLYLNPAEALSKLLVEGISVLYGEYYLLVFFSVAAIPVLLVPGIIFRALLPTRGLGGVMIAMAIGFYLVMPALFSAVYFFTAPGLTKDINLANAQMQSIALSGGVVTSPQSPLVQDLNNSQAALSGFWMLVLFYPVMIIAFTYSFIVQISKLIGGTYQSTAMGRIRRFI
jgi:hypothetical protein